MTKFDRTDLRKTYLAIVDGWALQSDEIAKATKLDRAALKPLLKELQRSGLIVAEHINGAKPLTYQSYHDVNNEPGARKQAVKDFQTAYGTRGPIERPERVGATGPKYTDEQIAKAVKMRVGGASWKSIGAALGIKATAYLSKRLTPQVEETRKNAAKATSKRTVARTAKRTAERQTAAAKRRTVAKAVAA